MTAQEVLYSVCESETGLATLNLEVAQHRICFLQQTSENICLLSSKQHALIPNDKYSVLLVSKIRQECLH